MIRIGQLVSLAYIVMALLVVIAGAVLGQYLPDRIGNSTGLDIAYLPAAMLAANGFLVALLVRNARRLEPGLMSVSPRLEAARFHLLLGMGTFLVIAGLAADAITTAWWLELLCIFLGSDIVLFAAMRPGWQELMRSDPQAFRLVDWRLPIACSAIIAAAVLLIGFATVPGWPIYNLVINAGLWALLPCCLFLIFGGFREYVRV